MQTMKKSTLVLLALAFAVMLTAFAKAPVNNGSNGNACLTEAQVLAHLDRSRQGISLTCNESIRQRNLARLHNAAQNHRDR